MRTFPNLYGFANTYENCRTVQFSTEVKWLFLLTGFTCLDIVQAYKEKPAKPKNLFAEKSIYTS
jgi:hypothetical protein